MRTICRKHMYRLRAVHRFPDSKAVYYMFQCEYCLHEYHSRNELLWPPKPIRTIRHLKLERISIDSTGMGQIISINDAMVKKMKRDLMVPRQRGW